MADTRRNSRYAGVGRRLRPVYDSERRALGDEPARQDLVLGRRYTNWATPSDARTHTVIVGETVWSIAGVEFDGNEEAYHLILDFNASVITDPFSLVPGTVLVIPPRRVVSAVLGALS